MSKFSNSNFKPPKNTYRSPVKEQLDTLKSNSVQIVKVDLTKINVRTLATDLGQLGDEVNLLMKLLQADRYYDLNDKHFSNLLTKGDVEMPAITKMGRL